STADLGAVAVTATRAFVDDPVMRWIFPDDVDYAHAHPVLARQLARRWLATDSLWCTDDVAALAGWIPPGRPDTKPVDDDPPTADVEHPAWRLERFAAIGTAFTANTPAEPHWYLNLLATHPDWQRRGLGATLMAAVFDIADADGVACYLETETVENVAYYRHHGFEVRTEWDLATAEVAGPHMWGMLRPPT
ncbi:MAG: GNAT family N-acetyltransferase, partial [Desertimonas sp.]